uniref:Mitochondrial import inner membrane translocase subunit Tim21 n=1 Tax=Ornithorhynchus anatinus TaxID=9258 RepID=F6Y278_ORNAN
MASRCGKRDVICVSGRATGLTLGTGFSTCSPDSEITGQKESLQTDMERGGETVFTTASLFALSQKQNSVFIWNVCNFVLFSLVTVKEAGRDFTYLIVVLVGISVTGGLFYVIFKELFSSSSPSKIYGDALEKCRAHPEVIGVFGEPIKGYGETTRRGRRQHVSHVEYVKDGTKRMRLKFYIEGSEPGKQGTVHLEMKENLESGKYEYRYIFVDVDAYPRRTIIIEDNR